MKRKWILALCASMLLAGCGQGSEGAANGGEGEKNIMSAEEEYKVEREADEVRTGTDSSVRTVRRQIEPVELKDEFQKAAFLADRIYEGSSRNVLVSPLSLDLALGLAAEGASGETAKELYDYLGSSDYGEFAREYMAYAESLTREKDSDEQIGSSGYSFQYNIANSIWVSDRRKLLKEYREAVEKKFLAEVDSLDFRKDIAKSLERINSWCNEKTNGLIPQILNEDALSQEPASILVNTVYFESPWIDKWGLTEHEFTGLDGAKTTQEMLSGTLGSYYENAYATAFGKPYFNGFQFIGILPKAEGDFQIGELDLKSLLESETSAYDVRALMPKLNYDTATGSREIVDILTAQGIQKAFDWNGAEFDRMLEMSSDEVTWIDDIIQKCKIELDENGTRAAAATAILMRCMSLAFEEPKEVKEVFLDRPFAFLIYDSMNEKIVFVGKVTELN